ARRPAKPAPHGHGLPMPSGRDSISPLDRRVSPEPDRGNCSTSARVARGCLWFHHCRPGSSCPASPPSARDSLVQPNSQPEPPPVHPTRLSEGVSFLLLCSLQEKLRDKIRLVGQLPLRVPTEPIAGELDHHPRQS